MTNIMKIKNAIIIAVFFINYCEISHGQCISGNCQNGFGIYIFENKSKYEGNWRNSRPNGKGTFTEVDQTYTYEGNFVNGVEHGLGKYKFRNGNVVTVYYPFAGDMILVKGEMLGEIGNVSEEELAKIISNDKSILSQNNSSELMDFTQSKRVTLIKEGGVFMAKVNINGIIQLHFIIDSGASEVNIPNDVVSTLIRAQAIKPEDFLPGRTYVLADGSMVKSKRFVVRSLTIGSTTVNNVEACIGDRESPLLLGQTFFEKFSSWSIDNNSNSLTLVR